MASAASAAAAVDVFADQKEIWRTGSEAKRTKLVKQILDSADSPSAYHTDEIKHICKSIRGMGSKSMQMGFARAQIREALDLMCFKEMCFKEMIHAIESKKLDVSAINKAVNTWFASLVSKGVVSCAGRWGYAGVSVWDQGVLENNPGKMIIVFHPHRFAARNPLDTGRPRLLDIREVFRFEQDHTQQCAYPYGYSEHDSRTDSVYYMGGTSKKDVAPAEELKAHIDGYVNYEIISVDAEVKKQEAAKLKRSQAQQNRKRER